ncbi:MAG: alpha-amylase family glycosyl hydrolase [Patescibacteria group bacterium]|nr:sugar phosphorylase [Patescibacteria group bacterium]
MIPKIHRDKIKTELKNIYGPALAKKFNQPLFDQIKKYISRNKVDVSKNLKYRALERLTEKTSIVITYGDTIRRKPGHHLKAFSKFAKKYLKGKMNTVHILPFYPYSSDRGFSVKNYTQVDPKIGTWQDVSQLGKNFNLMFDLVLNHASVKGEWFQKFLKQEPGYENFFIHFQKKDAIPKPQFDKILRPRTNKLLTEFKTKNNQVIYVWTTFSADQADLNYSDPQVLLEVIKVLLFYLEQSVDFIRLDAVTYAWKQLGTNCAHRPQAHAIVKLFRLILNLVKPDTAIITETNVPHKDNITYFGDGYNEAQAVYNFTLPPLTLHTFLTQDSAKLSQWAKTLHKPSPITAYLNFLDSHDGIGLLPAQNILSKKEINSLVKTTKKHGGLIGYRANNGKKTPYELNITWFSAINPKNTDSTQTKVKRYLASRAVALSLRGIPHIYILGLLSAGNDKAYALKTRINRNINRRNLDEQSVHDTFDSKGWSRFRTVSQALLNLLEIRSQEPAFHPGGKQVILPDNKNIFSLIRISIDRKTNILALINVTNAEQTFKFNLKKHAPKATQLTDIITQKNLLTGKKSFINITLEPYDIQWWKF